MNVYAGPLSTLEIHLDAIARNYLLLKKKLKSGADCAAVVKADAYGLGAGPVSRALFDQGCRHFFVAHFGEAAVLRHALPEKDAIIYVLNGPWGAEAKAFIEGNFVPVLNSLDDLNYWSGVCKAGNKRHPALLHVDTGMSRLGLSAREATRLFSDKTALQALDIRYIMSHLACADEPKHPHNNAQLTLLRTLTKALPTPSRLSFANSAGIFLGPDYHFDLARPGCALYGIKPFNEGENPMQGTVTLKGRILQTRLIDISSTVGYGASYRVVPPANCATVSVGYADGYLRSLTGRGAVVIGEKKCPVIGRVSMDTIIVDTTTLSVQPRAGDWAEIIGPGQTVDEVAEQAGTIGYEILTSLGKRYQRSYTGA
ncbi:MAG: alanine racemase [Alphaproteobacteria bacterium]|nr:MAG: alanine racemase [Alphaproteobacteria bacterium]